jgi:putative transposase
MVYLAHMRTAFALSNGACGSSPMHRDLVDEGHEIGRHRTTRLMRQNQLIARQKRRFKRTTHSEQAWPVAPSLVALDCIDPVKICSCYIGEGSDECDDGRQHQTVDSEA